MCSPYAFYKSAAFYTFLLLLFFVYIPQYFFHWYFTDYFEFLYAGNGEVTVFPIIFLIFLVFLVFIITAVQPRVSLNLKFKHYQILRLFKKILFVSFIVLFLLAALKFSFNYGIDFRHKNRLSEAGKIVVVLFFFRFIAMFYVFYVFTKILRGGGILISERLGLATILLSLSLTTTSSLSIPLLVIAGLLVILPQKNLRAFFLKRGHSSIIRPMLITILAVPVVFSILFFGYANKWGVEKAFDFFMNADNWILLATKIGTRLSTSYASVNAFINGGYLFDLEYQLTAFSSGIKTFITRLGMVTGLYTYTLESIESVNRMNFELLFNTYLPRAGTSPGPIASALYMPFFPVNFIVMALYIGFILRLFDNYVPMRHNELSIFSKLFLVYFLLPFLESPLSLFSIINPVVAYVCLFIVVSFFIDPKLRLAYSK